MVLHLLIDRLEKELELTPEQAFRLTADIKRLIHSEKASVYHRLFLYSEGVPVFEGEGEGDSLRVVGHETPADPFLNGICKQKFEQHDDMSQNYTDQELVTWDVGSHKFKQEVPPCGECGTNETETHGRVSRFENGNVKVFCLACAKKEGLLDEEDLD